MPTCMECCHASRSMHHPHTEVHERAILNHLDYNEGDVNGRKVLVLRRRNILSPSKIRRFARYRIKCLSGMTTFMSTFDLVPSQMNQNEHFYVIFVDVDTHSDVMATTNSPTCHPLSQSIRFTVCLFMRLSLTGYLAMIISMDFALVTLCSGVWTQHMRTMPLQKRCVHRVQKT